MYKLEQLYIHGDGGRGQKGSSDDRQLTYRYRRKQEGAAGRGNRI
jgi:hypothetical protein